MPGHIHALRTLRFEAGFLERGVDGITGRRVVEVFPPPYRADLGSSCACLHELVSCLRLTETDETIDSLYRRDTQEELEVASRNWPAAAKKRLAGASSGRRWKCAAAVRKGTA